VGLLQRRHVTIECPPRFIGKESNKLEEGSVPDAGDVYTEYPDPTRRVGNEVAACAARYTGSATSWRGCFESHDLRGAKGSKTISEHDATADPNPQQTQNNLNRQRGPMFEHWYQFAPQMSSRLGLAADIMTTAHDVVCSVMGGEWVERQSQHLEVPARSIVDVHPLFRALTGGTELSIIEVCELASYLVSFKSDPRLGGSIVALRDPRKYAAAVTELSVASKFKLAGAAVSLAPSTEHGIADFSAEVDGTQHVIEVSGFPSDPFQSDSMAFTAAMQTALKSGLKRSGLTRHVALEIDVLDSDADIRKEAHRAAVETMAAFAKGGAQSGVERDYAFGSVKVRPTMPREKPDTEYWTAAVCLQLVYPPATGLVTMADLRGGEDTHWLYVRLPAAKADPYERIRRKLKTEARQLSGSSEAVLLLDSGGLQHGIFSNDDPSLRGIAADFERQHSSTTAFGIFGQPLKSDGTRSLAGAYYALGPRALGTKFWRSIIDADRQSSVLSELSELAK
jgi:hypothetical protein